jgi:uncharacterized protein (TIGR02265 family)
MNATAATSSNPRRASLRECFEYTDLRWRLAQIPDRAACRGAFMNMLDDRAADLGRDTQNAYRSFFQTYRFSPFKFYPVKDYLTRIVTLAQIHFGGPNIYEGIHHIHAATYVSWKRTLLGQTAFAMLGNDFERVLRAAELGYVGSHFINYARLTVRRDAANRFAVCIGNEFVYIEHAMSGAVAGIAEACGARVALNVRMADPFNGEIGVTVL